MDINNNLISLICKTSLMQKVRVLAVKTRKGCRYHREDSKTFSFKKLTPDGLCMHAFHAVYASCLELLYAPGADCCEKIFVCPDIDNAVRFMLITKGHAHIKTRLINTIKYFLRSMGVPCDYQLRRIFIKVIGAKRPCPLGHKKGDIFEFNLGEKDEICPASFESLYPAVYSLHMGQINKNVSCDQDGLTRICIHCPSNEDGAKYDVLP